ncbi:MAG: biopolymer transporter ExbD [Gammaproteobacteria bacterium]|nr:biopolymer transporter ExbD [Gammaproteobacteria bacterium]
MNIRPSKKEELDVNITPLIDVVFLLLIFFMVSTTFKHENEITISLPESSSKSPPKENNIIEIAIDAKGTYYIDKRQVVNTELKTVMLALEKIAGDRKAPTILISADAQTPHQSVIVAMDAARQLGFVNLSIATKQNRSAEE